jgi:hypothetical protein
MSAKEVTVFLPKEFLAPCMLIDLAGRLGLVVDSLRNNEGLSYQFSAQGGEGRAYLLIEYKENDRGAIEDICRWERPSSLHKKALEKCESSITFYYRDMDRARGAFLDFGDFLGVSRGACVVENGWGCLLFFSSMFNRISHSTDWSWEKYEFPEFPDVALSEWR